MPGISNRWLFVAAPVLSFGLSLVQWAFIPFEDGSVLLELNLGLLYILAISSSPSTGC